MDLGNILILGIAIFGGLIGASLFKKVRIPEVVGFIVIGLILGQSGLKIVSETELLDFQPIVSLALGIIGFLVGSELKAGTFRKYGKEFSSILLGEGVTSFIFVTVATFFLFNHFLHDINGALAGAVVLGAIASATDPASTLSVLWEYRTLGILTTSLVAIVALDDALAMTLYGLGSGAASVLAGSSGSFVSQMSGVVSELFIAILLGAAAAMILALIIKKISDSDKLLAFAMGILLLVVGVGIHNNLDIILMTMAFGCVLTNYNSRRSEPLVELVRRFSNPIYILFFVLAGARLNLGNMPTSLWMVVLAYIVARTLGKILGSSLGARIAGSQPVVRKYLGLGLFTQGGVAIGLSIMASHKLSAIPLGNMSLGDAIISVVAATTFIVQIIGPPMVKLSAKLAGEEGRDVKAGDVIKSWKVVDAMSHSFQTLREGTTISSALETVAESDYHCFPVISEPEEIVGILSLDNMKRILRNNSSWAWLVVSDVMQSPDDIIDSASPLEDALKLITKLGVQELVVTETHNGVLVPVGILNHSSAMIRVEAEALERRTPAVSKPRDKKAKKTKDDSRHTAKVPKKILGDALVSSVRNIIVQDATSIELTAGITELLDAFLEDMRVRYVYIVNKDKLIGFVSLNSIVKYLFPYDAMYNEQSETFIGNYVQFDIDKIEDITDFNPLHVFENSTLSEVARILMEENINELPVVDEHMKLIGQISVYEVISWYLSSKLDRE